VRTPKSKDRFGGSAVEEPSFNLSKIASADPPAHTRKFSMAQINEEENRSAHEAFSDVGLRPLPQVSEAGDPVP
jgi:hypothetical protein